MTIAIETRGLTRVHGETRALDDVSVKIRANTITGLLGRNGAGKTTFMSLATAQDLPTSGEVLIDVNASRSPEGLGAAHGGSLRSEAREDAPEGAWEESRAQGERPFEHAKVLEQMCFIRDNQRYPDDYKLKHALRAAAIFYPNWSQEFADELVALFRVPTKTIVKKFSRGQFSALGIVIGLASRAPVTFFDEPYLGLDATARAYFYDVLLRDHIAHPRTIVLSTHLIDEMDRLLERVVILDGGRVVQDADVDELRGMAHQAAGRAAAVEQYATGRKVLSRHRVGGLATVVVEGGITAEDRAAASEGEVELAAVSLQELVAAYGFDGQDSPGSVPAAPDPHSESNAAPDARAATQKGARS